MFRNMATSLIEEERIETTTAKAKELRSIVEKLITLGRRNAESVVSAASDDVERQRRVAARVAAVRQAGKQVRNRYALQKLFGEIAERFVDRPGGYTRVLRLGTRLGDNAEMAIIELLPDGYEKSAGAPRAERASAPAPVAEVVVEEESTGADLEAQPDDVVAESTASEGSAPEAAAEEAAPEAAAEETAPEAAAEEKKTDDSE
jgi:large subunit ribosomal protein L17